MQVPWTIWLVAVAIAVPEIAGAQPPARTFDELSTHVGRTDEVWITDDSGKETKSRIVTIASSMLTVNTRHGRLDLRAADIVRVRQKRPDPIWNGVLIGALAGAAYPLWYFSKGYETGESLGENVDGVAAGAVVGACLGALIDHRIKGKKVIYERPRERAVHITPAFAGGRVSVRFTITD